MEKVSESLNLKEILFQNKWIKWFLAVLIPGIIFMMPLNNSFTYEIKMFFVITIFIMALWAMELLPVLIPSLMLPILYFTTKLASTNEVFASWGTQLPWLFLSGMIISSIFERTGLMKRIACWSILKAGGSYTGILYGFFFSGILMGLLVPSGAGKVALYTTLSYGICKAMKVSPTSNVSSTIMLGGYFAAIGPLYLTGGGSNIIAFDIASKYGVNVSWIDYFIQMGIPSIIFTFILIFSLKFLFKRDEEIFEEKNKEHTKKFFLEEYKSLGKFSKNEKKMALILGLIVLGLLTNSIHKIAPGWIFVMGACLCFMPGIEIGNDIDIKNVKFPMIVFMASAMCIGNVSIATGAGNYFAEKLYVFLHGGEYVVTGMIWLVGVLINFILTPLAAVSGLMNPLLEAGLKAGLKPLPVIYSFLQGIEQILLPYENATVLFLFGFGLITFKNLIKAFAWRMLLNIIFILLFCVPYWMMLGLF
ncbi:MAG: SLC13 family permease [Cetobacterium sp.]|uniref:SLC13 family permease n=1 Tax=Cetobacterium sp. TaxID=2071632 RepID=UPI003F413523